MTNYREVEYTNRVTRLTALGRRDFANLDCNSCSAFYAAKDTIALAGKNKNAISADHYLWFCPPEGGKYGGVYFGCNFFLDQKEDSNGINDQGLYFNMDFGNI